MSYLDDLKYALPELLKKRCEQAEYWQFYDGEIPPVYTTAALQKVFGNKIQVNFRLNWCAPVVDSMAERINLVGFDVADNEDARKQLNKIVSDLWLNVEADDVTKATIICGESFLIAGKNPDTQKLDVYYNDPRLCYAVYREDRPKELEFVLKLAQNRDQSWMAILYYEDVIVTWRTETGKALEISNLTASSFYQESEEQHGYSRIPVFHFRRSPRRLVSELENVKEPQKAINKIFVDMMIASDAASIGKRWVVSNAEDIQTSLSAGENVWVFPAADRDTEETKVGAFPTANLDGYQNTINQTVEHIAAITRTPKHLFFGSGGTPSGEALIAMEAPLVKKCEDFIERVTPAWADLGRFLLELEGVSVPAGAIVPQWQPCATVQPRTAADILKTQVDAGLPLSIVLKKELGWTDEEVSDVEDALESDSNRRARVEAIRRTAINGKANADAARNT